jgi:hypothetical protein
MLVVRWMKRDIRNGKAANDYYDAEDQLRGDWLRREKGLGGV